MSSIVDPTRGVQFLLLSQTKNVSSRLDRDRYLECNEPIRVDLPSLFRRQSCIEFTGSVFALMFDLLSHPLERVNPFFFMVW